MILTIAFVVYNEEKRLNLIRANLQVLKHFRDQVKTVIVDNASTDATYLRLNALRSTFGFDLVSRRSNNLGAARAEAVTMASTPWVGFIDADCLIDDAWVRSALQRLSSLSNSVAAIGGSWQPAGDQKEVFSSLFKTFCGHFNMAQIKNENYEHGVRHIPTAAVIYRRSDVLSAGNFDPRREKVGEDLDLSYRLLAAGKELRLIPQLRVRHYLPDNLSDWTRKIFSYGIARINMAMDYNDVWSLTYLLPLMFFAFVMLNLIFFKLLLGLPILAYVAVCAIVSAISDRSPRMGTVMTYMMATHGAYAFGMAYGAIQATVSSATSFLAEKVLKRKRLDPIGYKPQPAEKI